MCDKMPKENIAGILFTDVSLKLIFFDTYNSYGIISGIGFDSYSILIIWFIKRNPTLIEGFLACSDLEWSFF